MTDISWFTLQALASFAKVSRDFQERMRRSQADMDRLFIESQTSRDAFAALKHNLDRLGGGQ